jgi:hypothetical protein
MKLQMHLKIYLKPKVQDLDVFQELQQQLQQLQLQQLQLQQQQQQQQLRLLQKKAYSQFFLLKDTKVFETPKILQIC